MGCKILGRQLQTAPTNRKMPAQHENTNVAGKKGDGETSFLPKTPLQPTKARHPKSICTLVSEFKF